jgi:hypothetical protein
VLQVVGEPVQRIREGAKVGESLFRIADFHNPARRIVSVNLDGQRIVRPYPSASVLNKKTVPENFRDGLIENCLQLPATTP